ncbi:MAG TPA: N-acetyltransferase family protein [Clostridia bacterium]|jgi:phosphinothricin acetyltransferase|nr:N-acetyltransferase [Clostridia bacterium]MDD4502314.1 GNAT family N-acetyltransferase [Clostridia bacterium]HPB16867.1 N-acetyltransferase family protein [Clostridia bacterium]HQM96316.1 N-acetyltransferase family protein [Clostridia bacterium]HQO69352.1 N-acetyltransferase family protein [Clostridia bacterium]
MIREMQPGDWNEIKRIYQQGIDSKNATFETAAPEYSSWDNSHLRECRLVSVNPEGKIDGWVALSPTSCRQAYKGVAEVSIYIDKDRIRQHIGYTLMQKLISLSEEHGIWTLYSSIIATNHASISFHMKCGFRIIGTREKIAKDSDGIWTDTVIMERRSNVIF